MEKHKMADKRQKVVIEMGVLLPEDMDNAEIIAQETGIKTLLTNLLRKWGTYPLTASDVTDIKVTIVPAAAAGEGEGMSIVAIPLYEEQRERAKIAIGARLPFVPIGDGTLLLCPKTKAVYYLGRMAQLNTVLITQEEVDSILG